MKTSQHESRPDEVDHWTPYSHWCSDCWHFVVDCEHCLDPLPIQHHSLNDGCIQSIAYDRATQRLEVRFKWKAVQQYRPVSLSLMRELWKARPIDAALSELVKNNRRIRFDEVRSEGKVLVSMLRGWKMLQKPTSLMPAQ